MGQTTKKWKVLSSGKEKAILGLPKWLISVLSNRGLKSEQKISSYLEPKYEDLADSKTFLNVTDAVKRIAEAKEKQEKIVVYGDYDVDGITATALMFEVLSKIGIQKIETYIPHREEEGYGLNQKALDEIITGGANLIITVDCGISSDELIAGAKAKNVDVIVCDHHEIDAKRLPKDAIILHPNLVLKGTDPSNLSACGMAFFLAKALQKEFPEEFPQGQEKWLLDLVALATICDVVPLVGQNRILAKFGLKVLEKTKRVGIQELMRVSGVKPEEVSSYAVGFLLGPRLNAAGRLEHAKKALELLLTKDKNQAILIASDLNKLNAERQQMCDKILDEAKAEIESVAKNHPLFI